VSRSEDPGTTRRSFLVTGGAGLAGLVWSGCCRGPICLRKGRYELHARFRGQRYLFHVDARLRAGPLALNQTTRLRRYKGHATVAAREAQLISLAWTAEEEDAFFLTLPDNVWTEVGALTERGGNRAGVHGVRPLPMRSLLDLFSGKVEQIPKPERIVSYHYHPRKLAHRALRDLGPERIKRFGGLERMVRVIHLPSASDFHLHVWLQTTFAARGVAVTSKVAVPDAIIGYDVSPPVASRVLSGKRVTRMREMLVYERARVEYARHEWSREQFRQHLTVELKRAGFKGNEFRLRVDRRGSVDAGGGSC
jgi:hypothetical protein